VTTIASCQVITTFVETRTTIVACIRREEEGVRDGGSPAKRVCAGFGATNRETLVYSL
jgi:hypothetical protein